MNNGFVIFVVRKRDYKPYFLKFGLYNNKITYDYVSDASEATIYPIYEAAEVVANTIKDDSDDYLCIKIFDANGNPCSNGENSNGRVSSDTRYVRKSSPNDDFF
jgi:hypothetical protein